jgi:hypothetical protein
MEGAVEGITTSLIIAMAIAAVNNPLKCLRYPTQKRSEADKSPRGLPLGDRILGEESIIDCLLLVCYFQHKAARNVYFAGK